LKTNRISELENIKGTQDKRKEVKEKLKRLGETDDNVEEILASIECYCQLVLQIIV
jgi:hypothetical protein